MLVLQDYIDLKNKILNNEIELNCAKELCWSNIDQNKKSWHSKDWKERRKNHLKDNCEICGSTSVLTIQHLSHPQKYSFYKNLVSREFMKNPNHTNETIEKEELLKHILNNYHYSPVPLCPNCKHRRPNQRITKKPEFLCTICHSEFDKCEYLNIEDVVNSYYKDNYSIYSKDKSFISIDKWRNHHNIHDIIYWFKRNKSENQNLEEIEKISFLLYLDDNIKYLSFEDTITACKKCASSFDLHEMELCPKCKKYYKGIRYPSCIQCLPEDSRKIALEKIEFGKNWEEMHKELGID